MSRYGASRARSTLETRGFLPECDRGPWISYPLANGPSAEGAVKRGLTLAALDRVWRECKTARRALWVRVNGPDASGSRPPEGASRDADEIHGPPSDLRRSTTERSGSRACAQVHRALRSSPRTWETPPSISGWMLGSNTTSSAPTFAAPRAPTFAAELHHHPRRRRPGAREGPRRPRAYPHRGRARRRRPGSVVQP